MRGVLFMAHSGVRYLVLLSAVVAIVYLITALRRSPDRTSNRVMSIFTGMVDLQVLLGLLTLITVPFYGALAGHIMMMFAAVFVGHGFVIANRQRPADQQSNGRLLVGVVITLALIIGGILAIGRPIIGTGA